jgi:hypothetical protein
MAFTFESIVRLFVRTNPLMSIKEAGKIADELMGMHSERVCIVENNAREVGKLEGYEKGYAAGKMDSEEYERGYNDGVNNKFNNDELVRLAKIEDKMISMAEITAKTIAQENPKAKLRAVRLLMEVSGLDVVPCKKIMDELYGY